MRLTMAARSVALFPVDRFQLQPVARPDAGLVRTVDTFRDDALDIEFGAGVKKIARRTVERPDRANARSDEVERFECAPTGLRLRPVAEVVVVEDEQIEREERGVPATRSA
jgi:hypothetical protein